MKRIILWAIPLALSLCVGCTQHPSIPLTVEVQDSLKLGRGYHNPILDHLYCADPTAVEYQERLYVYGTNDQQQCDETHPDSANSYERINSLAMMSTDDMVNWTYHGLIQTKQLAPWIIASWAPSICAREESDGKTHFYLYYSNSGYGTGVLTATSPVGPWTSPLDSSLVDAKTPGLGDCTVPFDPGVVIDEQGTGWLAFGAGKARLARLGKDMISFDSPFVVLPASNHFEANELNVIGGRMVYTYNLDWTDKKDWKEKAQVPTRCSMGYMLQGDDPLDSKGWKYQDYYLMNPGDDGFEYSNNHTHLHKYQGQWYLFHHTMVLKHVRGIQGGYRSLAVDRVEVDESNQQIHLTHATNEGVAQIRLLNPMQLQQMETTFATYQISFVNDSTQAGNLWVKSDTTGVIMLKGVDFTQQPRNIEYVAQGKGQIDVRLDSIDGKLIGSTYIDNPQMTSVSDGLIEVPAGTHDLVFLMNGKNLCVDTWQMK